jgi:capsular exopolysaccharide synthesis family protein
MVVPLVAVCLALVASALMTPAYESRTKLFVSATPTAGGANDLLQGNNFTQARVRSYVDLVSTDAVLGPVIAEQDLDTTVSALAERVSSSSPLDTVLIEVRVSDGSPERAAVLADAVSASLVDVVTDLETAADGGPSAVKLSVVEQAQVSTGPVSPQPVLNALVGLVLGLGLAVVAVVAWDALDTRVRSAEQASEALDAPVLTALQTDAEMSPRWLVSQETGFSSQAEALRRLRTNLQFLDVQSQRRSFVITSSVAGEGKTTVSVNLALTVAAAGLRVVLVDADLRRPRIADYLDVEGSVGLTTVLIGRAEVADVVQPWGPDGTVHFIASGEVPPNPSELLGSAEMEKLVRRLEAEYDVVLIDSPPSLPVTDPSILAAMCSGAIVVVSAGIARRDQLGVVRHSLDAAGATLLGVVVNRLKSSGGSYGGYGTYSQAYGTAAPAVPRQRGISRLVPALRRG